MLGFILRTTVIAVSIISYTVISKINSPVIVKDDDRNLVIEKILLKKSWKKLMTGFIPKKEKARKKLEFKLKKALSKMELPHFYAKKTAFAVMLFSLSLILIILSVNLGKDFALTLRHNYSLLREKREPKVKQIP